jgi:hypothetical protein
MSEVQMDGPMQGIPGFANLPQGGIPYFWQSGLVDLTAATANIAPLFMPMNYTILALRWRVRVAPGTANATVRLGTTATAAQYASTVIATTDGAGTVITSTLLATDGNAGDTLVFGSAGGATATGGADGTVIWTPR